MAAAVQLVRCPMPAAAEAQDRQDAVKNLPQQFEVGENLKKPGSVCSRIVPPEETSDRSTSFSRRIDHGNAMLAGGVREMRVVSLA
jgi:hypothetical protein